MLGLFWEQQGGQYSCRRNGRAAVGEEGLVVIRGIQLTLINMGGGGGLECFERKSDRICL